MLEDNRSNAEAIAQDANELGREMHGAAWVDTSEQQVKEAAALDRSDIVDTLKTENAENVEKVEELKAKREGKVGQLRQDAVDMQELVASGEMSEAEVRALVADVERVVVEYDRQIEELTNRINSNSEAIISYSLKVEEDTAELARLSSEGPLGQQETEEETQEQGGGFLSRVKNFFTKARARGIAGGRNNTRFHGQPLEDFVGRRIDASGEKAKKSAKRGALSAVFALGVPGSLAAGVAGAVASLGIGAAGAVASGAAAAGLAIDSGVRGISGAKDAALGAAAVVPAAILEGATVAGGATRMAGGRVAAEAFKKMAGVPEVQDAMNQMNAPLYEAIRQQNEINLQLAQALQGIKEQLDRQNRS